MAKEDNPRVFEKEERKEQERIKEEMKKEKEKEEMKYINMYQDPTVFMNRFEDNDFTMVRFLRHLDTTMFSNRLDAYNYIKDNLHKVCALIGIRTLIIKNDLICNSDQIIFDNIETFGKDQLIKYEDMNPSKPVTLYKVLFGNRDFICRYEKISTDIAYKGNNVNEFYITRPFIASKVEYTEDDLEFILEFIRHIVCSDDIEVYEAFIRWLAFMVQYPNKKSGIVPVFISKEGGTGKTMFIEFIAKFILGEHLYAPVNDVNGIVKEQNKYLMGRKLAYVNEMASCKDHFISNFQKLKGLITEDSFSVKALYKDPIFMKQFLEFIFTANNTECLPLEKKDRRFLPIRFNDERVNDFAYFDLFERTTYNIEYGNKFYSYLMDLPDVSISTVRKIPVTELKKEMLESSINSYDSFIEDLFNYQLMDVINRYKEENDTYHIVCENFYDHYVEYQKRKFSTEKLISYRKFIARVKSKDTKQDIKHIQRTNGHHKSKFILTLPKLEEEQTDNRLSELESLLDSIVN
jgi:hypothetical protein